MYLCQSYRGTEGLIFGEGYEENKTTSWPGLELLKNGYITNFPSLINTSWDWTDVLFLLGKSILIAHFLMIIRRALPTFEIPTLRVKILFSVIV